MAIKYHPEPGTIVICDFKDFKAPEMTKKRPAIVVSPRFRDRPGLCTVVPCSTTRPTSIQPYHYELVLFPSLPAPYYTSRCWVKCDMLYAVSFSRLSMPSFGRDSQNSRMYDVRVVSQGEFRDIRQCVIEGIANI